MQERLSRRAGFLRGLSQPKCYSFSLSLSLSVSPSITTTLVIVHATSNKTMLDKPSHKSPGCSASPTTITHLLFHRESPTDVGEASEEQKVNMPRLR
jgi:hypothetical protein